MIRRYLTTALLAAALLLIGSGAFAMDDRSRHTHPGIPMSAASAQVTYLSQPVSWDVSISVGKRGGHRHHRHGHGYHRHYRHGHRHYGYQQYPYYHHRYYRSPYDDYRDQGHPDYGYRSYGYRSNRYDSDGNYLYKGGRYRYWYPYGHGYGYRHRY
jgi:hypothetical protein